MVLVLLASCQYVLAREGDCPTLPDEATLESLISGTFNRDDRPDVRVRDLKYVCLVSGMFKGTFRRLSVVVSYDCSRSSLCPSTSLVSQFDFTCNSGNVWGDDVLGTSEFSRSDIADADLTTPNHTNCSYCVAPNHPLVEDISQPYDNMTHCFGIQSNLVIQNLTECMYTYTSCACLTACDASCNHGDMRCFDYTSDECCSFYDPHDNDKCLNECPPDRLITENFDCTGT